MPSTEFNKANADLVTYITAVKEEEKIFNARNVVFCKDNPLTETLAVVNPADENQYWKYTEWIAMLDKEDDINNNIKMLDFLSDQLRFRLRVKSKEAHDLRDDLKKLKTVFKDIIANQDAQSF